MGVACVGLAFRRAEPPLFKFRAAQANLIASAARSISAESLARRGWHTPTTIFSQQYEP
jgi:hypothetical protein